MTRKNTALSVAALLLVGATVTACLDEENPTITNGDPITRFTATLNGQQEKPTSTTSTATGTFAGVLNETSRVLSYTTTYQGLTPTGGHLHRINQANGTGPIDIPFASLTSPIIGSTTALTTDQVAAMKAGQYYVNLHTPAYPAGEIRGDITVR